MGKYSMTTRGRSFKWNPDFSVGGFKGNMRHPLDDAWDSMDFPWDWNNYESVLEWSTYPVIGGIFRSRASQLEYAENRRWLDDYKKNTGADYSNSKYPIRAGVYRGYASPYSASLSATESIMSLYGGTKLFKW